MTSVAAHLPAARCHSANVAALLQFSAVIPVFFFVTLCLQEVQRYSTLRAGLSQLPAGARTYVADVLPGLVMVAAVIRVARKRDAGFLCAPG